MEDNFDFDKVGKRMPYKVPPAFFDKITETTLAEAERRSGFAKKQVSIKWWPAMAVAACLALLLAIGYALYTGRSVNDSRMAVSEQEKAEQTLTPDEKLEAPAPTEEQPTLAQVEVKTQPEKKVAEEKPKPTISPKTGKAESLEDVLASLTDDELMLLAAVAETDLNVYEQTFE